MFDIQPFPQQIDASLLEKLAGVETATVGHVLHSQFADRELRAVLPEKRIAGTAVTLRIPHADSTLLHYAVSQARPGDFFVIDRGGDTIHACWGGVVTNVAKLNGVVGAVIDGPATDFNEIRRCDMPMWCRGPSPITTKLLGIEGGLNVPVSVGGCVVEPGDAVLADESGVLFLKPSQVEEIADTALGMQARELELLKKLEGGASLAELTGAAGLVEAKRRA
ncbi:RraA family protein [Oricola thermophila]|uniref:Putative 4-hydroxy-4-methyl-2-oxoglutarate aldolase n=1 Tax=Oricola thermophila TaxID=2742145 RepID=A0A6N1V829_9HYPH|nr:RraA family protein [Oricola thermophila]QKV17050.1 RraA family protein [Oricola thermophila]